MNSDEPTRYQIGVGDVAEAQITQATFTAIGRLGTERGQQWSFALNEAVESLSVFPHRNQIDPIDGPAFPDRDVRCHLFQFRSLTWRILYYIVEPKDGSEEGQVWILRFRHASARPLGQMDAEDEE